jgi:hypothetical protein
MERWQTESVYCFNLVYIYERNADGILVDSARMGYRATSYRQQDLLVCVTYNY